MSVSIGILFNGFVSAMISGVAFALIIFLRRRYQQLNATMRAYTWFWWVTALVWLPVAIRYSITGFGYAGPWLRYLDIIVQAAVFFTGPPLFVYVTLRLFKNEKLANWLGLVSLALGCVSLWLVLKPDGIPVRDVTFFSADAAINQTSFIIFGAQAGLILALLFFDIVSSVRTWKQTGRPGIGYEILYSTAIVIYIVLGSVDESKIIIDWPLVVFRMLNAGAFLAVYLTMTQEEASKAAYLTTEERPLNDAYAA